MADKDSIRQQILKKRTSLDAATVRNLSHFIQEAVLESNQFKNSSKIAVYDGIRNEVRTNKIIRLSMKSGKEVFFPHWDPDQLAIRFFKATDITQLEKKNWGTREPQPDPDTEISVQELDFILIPGVSFDKQGYRLGYGYGGYDRVLAGVTHRSCGLAYDFQIVDQLPIEPHDVPCAQVITEKRHIETL